MNHQATSRTQTAEWASALPGKAGSRPRARRGARFFLCAVALLALLVALPAPARAQGCDSCGQGGGTGKEEKVKVGFTGSVCSSSGYTITLNGAAATGSGSCTANSWVTTSKTETELTVDKTYQLVAGTDSCATHIVFDVPPKYRVEVNGVRTTTIDAGGTAKGSGDGTWNVVVRKCRECEENEEITECEDPSADGVNWSASLGKLPDGRSAQAISIRENFIGPAIYTPAALTYAPPMSGDIDVVRSQDGSVRQIRVPRALGDVVVISANEYEIRFYDPANVGAKTAGLYAVSGQPFVTWRVRNPDPSTTNRLQISEVQGATTRTSEYAWDAVTNSWSLSRGDGARVEARTKTPLTATSWIETTIIKDAATGQIASKVARTYHTFAWGDELIEEVLDPDGAALKTTYSYYENSSEPGRYRKVKSVAFANGSWEKYDYDSNRNRILVMRPWKDLSLETATAANSHTTSYTYSNSDGVKVSPYPHLVSSIIEKIAGTVVRKATYTRAGTQIGGEPASVETETVYSSSSAAQTSSTTTYHATASAHLANKIAVRVRPDGTRDAYTYEKGDYTANADPAFSQFAPNPNGAAWRETVVEGTSESPDGVAFKTKKRTTVRDQRGHAVLRETYVYTGAGYERVAWDAMDYNSRGKLTQTRRSNGELATSTWDGDLKTSHTDASGVEMVYTYDGLGRVKTETKKGVAASGPYPAQPDITVTYTYDAESHATGETIAGGGHSLSRANSYDAAGRIRSETDNAGVTTVYSYTNGGRTQTATRPGGATETKDLYLDGQVKSITGTAVVALSYDYGVNADGTRFSQEFAGAAGLGSPRWTRTTTDWMGRTIKIEPPGFTGANVVRTTGYNNKGQAVAEGVTSGATKLLGDMLTEFDDLGREVRRGLDVDGDGALSPASMDRFTDTEYAFRQQGADWFDEEITATYLGDNNGTKTVVRAARKRLNNFPGAGSEKTVSEVGVTDEVNQTTIITTNVDRAAKKVTVKIDAPDSNVDSVSVTVNGLLQSSSPSTPQSVTTYAYDGLARLTGVTDPRRGTTGKAYHATTGQLASESDAVQTTVYEYYPAAHNNAGLLKSKTDARGKKSFFGYNSRGQMTRMWGDAQYPLEYSFDDYGQMSELRTFRGGQNWGAGVWPASTAGAADVTRWVYHAPTGLLERKRDAAGKEMVYSFDLLGRASTRTWARLDSVGNPVSATYSYDPSTGELAGVNYSDATPDVSFAYDRGGRARTITDAAGTHARTFNLRGELKTDLIAGGVLDLVQVNTTYDAFQRRQSAGAVRGANALASQTYGYDAASRLETVTSGGQTVTYSYDPASGLLGNTSYTGGTSVGRGYDSLGRLQSITTAPASGPAQSYTYTYNNLHQRTRVTREDGSYWAYDYNDRGEVASGKKFWSDNTPVFGQQTEYAFDNAGNRTAERAGGNTQGALRQSAYAPNALNQYAQRTAPGALDVTGTANGAATVTVNNGPTARRGEYFYSELAVDNSTAPVYAQVNVVGARNNFGAGGEDAVTEKGGRAYVPPAVEGFGYDADGNLTSDGRWNYTWDAEGRLAAMESKAGVPAEARLRLEFAYDWAGRRIQKKVSGWDGATASYQLQSVSKFIYDGSNLLAELDGAGALVRSYVWGQDLSGGVAGGGGVGALLLVNQGGQTYHAGYDGSGNVTTLVNAGTGTAAASYEYDPFGNTLKAVGDFAASNPLRFSTKYADAETGLVYYGFRYYQPQTGRWLSRDPLGEEGGANLYGFVGNNPVSRIDPFGLYEEDVHYYLTYYLMRQTGCFSRIQAQNAAEGAQKVDEQEPFEPELGLTPAQIEANERYHALTDPRNHEGNLNRLLQPALEGGQANRQQQLTLFGRYVHYFQDTFSHAGFTNPTIGHGHHGHHPDQPFRTPESLEKAMRMARETYEKMREYAAKLKCCDPSPTDGGNVQWDKVREFLSMPAGDFLHSINNEELERKRRLLTDYKGYPMPRRGQRLRN